MVKDPTNMAALKEQRSWLISFLPNEILSELDMVERAISELEKKAVDKCDRPDCGCSCRFCKDNSGDVIPPFCCH